MTEPTKVYFVQDDAGHIKIGYSRDPWARISAHQVGASTRLELLAVMPGGRETEGALHQRFRKHRISGEWFRQHDELTDLIKSIRITYDQRRPVFSAQPSEYRSEAEELALHDLLICTLDVCFPGTLPEKAAQIAPLIGSNRKTIEAWFSKRSLPSGLSLLKLCGAHKLFGFVFIEVAPEAYRRTKKIGCSYSEALLHCLQVQSDLLQAKIECPF